MSSPSTTPLLCYFADAALLKSDPTLLHGDPTEKGAMLARSLTSRFDRIKSKYKDELEPLISQKESLAREIFELRETRDLYLEESTALSAKNDELAELNTRLTKKFETLQDTIARQRLPLPVNQFRQKQHISGSPSMSSIMTTATISDASDDIRQIRIAQPVHLDNNQSKGRFKWYKSSKGPETIMASTSTSSKSSSLAPPSDKSKGRTSHDIGTREHIFQQHSILRFSRCEHCQEKMWGLQELKCAACGVVCHAKCSEKLGGTCKPVDGSNKEEPVAENGPSMFGRDLTEQIDIDGKQVPFIVTKCIEAVEAQGKQNRRVFRGKIFPNIIFSLRFTGMDYEGIYRKTGGSSLSKQITHLFERGDYEAFDLRDMDRFNDINSTTSVMKTYFRSLPNPLLTHELHEDFVSAACKCDLNTNVLAVVKLTYDISIP